MKYRPHLVAFLDILGFSQICLRSENNDTERAKLDNIFRSCSEISENFGFMPTKSKIKSMIVSDSVILALPLMNETPTVEELANFFLASGKFQYYLAQEDIWLRGGISIGSLYIDPRKKLVVGPALIHAINLEKKVARYPRIVVDQSVMLQYRSKNAKEFRSEINRLYERDGQRALFEWSRNFMNELATPGIPNDIPLFIDFMGSVSHDAENGDLVKIAKMVSKGLTGPLEHYEKYRWLADYILTSFNQRQPAPQLVPDYNKLEMLLG